MKFDLKQFLEKYLPRVFKGKVLNHSLRDSAYGRIPAQAGPTERVFVKLTPVDPERRGATVSVGARSRRKP